MNVLKLLYVKWERLILRRHSDQQLRGTIKGRNNNVFGNINIVAPCNLRVGNDCSFNHGCYINASNGVNMGNDVILSAKCCVVSTGIDYDAWIKGDKRHIKDGKVCIGNHVWIGVNATILPGITISGEYVIVAANSVVTQDITESYCIYGGIPARKIKKLK